MNGVVEKRGGDEMVGLSSCSALDVQYAQLAGLNWSNASLTAQLDWSDTVPCY
jgi:hypothetical protein